MSFQGPPSSFTDELLTDRQVTERWSTSANTLRRLRYAGALPVKQIGPLARTSLSAVLEYEDGLRVEEGRSVERHRG